MFTDIDTVLNVAPDSLADEVISVCNGCNLCTKDCSFLSKYGNPEQIVRLSKTDPDTWQTISFECSLCGLCNAVCPKGLDISALFLDFRQKAFKKGGANFPEHGGILSYEKKGTSKRYSYYSLHENCDTIFFPGCTLPGTRPVSTLKAFEYLEKHIENIGIVLDCCTKPSHDLGRQDYFDAMFSEMERFLLEKGIKNIIVACPNCHRIFTTYGNDFDVKTVYEIMAQNGIQTGATLKGDVTIHDPCPVRFENNVHDSVRSLIQKTGLDIADTKHSKTKTVCCGEGGTVKCIAPELANKWTEKRLEDANNKKIASYCAGCVNLLSKKADSFHILDLMFDPENTINGKAKVAKAPFTYLNRIKLKQSLKKRDASITRERLFSPVKENEKGMAIKLMVLTLIIATIVGIKFSDFNKYLDQESLSSLIQGFGNLGPMIYILIYTIAPALFLPGLPITIVGGIVFGPFWGVVYTITGSTIGAGIAFLISRYVSKNFIESKLNGPKWIKLQDGVEKHGWKMVAFTRLIPLFPFNILNYAFGLTRIKFSHYIITTFICMLPACIAFIVLSSSLLELLKGQVSKEFIIGLILIALISLIPVVYKNVKDRNGSQAPL